MKKWTVEFQVPEIVDVPAESEEEAIEVAWGTIIDFVGYLYAGATEQIDEENDILSPDG